MSYIKDMPSYRTLYPCLIKEIKELDSVHKLGELKHLIKLGAKYAYLTEREKKILNYALGYREIDFYGIGDAPFEIQESYKEYNGEIDALISSFGTDRDALRNYRNYEKGLQKYFESLKLLGLFDIMNKHGIDEIEVVNTKSNSFFDFLYFNCYSAKTNAELKRASHFALQALDFYNREQLAQLQWICGERQLLFDICKTTYMSYLDAMNQCATLSYLCDMILLAFSEGRFSESYKEALLKCFERNVEKMSEEFVGMDSFS